MANIKSAKKRMKTNEKRRRTNTQAKSAVRTEAKKVQKSLDSKEAKDPAVLSSVFAGFVKKIDKNLYVHNVENIETLENTIVSIRERLECN